MVVELGSRDRDRRCKEDILERCEFLLRVRNKGKRRKFKMILRFFDEIEFMIILFFVRGLGEIGLEGNNGFSFRN